MKDKTNREINIGDLVTWRRGHYDGKMVFLESLHVVTGFETDSILIGKIKTIPKNLTIENHRWPSVFEYKDNPEFKRIKDTLNEYNIKPNMETEDV